MNVYTDSTANCSFDGTMAALRAERVKKLPATITERKTKRTGLVKRILSPKIGAKSKSALLGGTKPGLA
jgi:hypothetical protein